MTSLDLALVGNGAIGALVDAGGAIVWCCFPEFDGDPVFCSLLQGDPSPPDFGRFAIDLRDTVKIEQQYVADTPVLVTRCHDAHGGAVEITDFAPRFEKDGRLFCPQFFVREIKPVSGTPSIRLLVRPADQYGCRARAHSVGVNHIRFDIARSRSEPASAPSSSSSPRLLLLTDAPIQSIVDGTLFHLTEPVVILFGLDEPVQAETTDTGRRMLDHTIDYWRRWVEGLTLPTEWRDAVVRAAITLQLNVVERTGAIVAAMTTSIPEAPDSGRNWDYRYCWPRDSWFVVDALSRLGDLRTTPRYLRFLLGVADRSADASLRPAYGLDGGPVPEERQAECLGGYRGMGPVHIGNAAGGQIQNDVYGAAVLSAAPMFLGSRSGPRADGRGFEQLEKFGGHAARLFDVPDAGLWELRGIERVHTFSSLMCWAACDRLDRYAAALGLSERAVYWRVSAARIRETIERRSWNANLGAYTAAMEGDTLDASLLLMPLVGFLRADDPRFAGTVRAIERDLRHGDLIYRYVERDHLGYPANAFLVCTFWYISALSEMGRRVEAKSLFEKVLAARNRHGLLAEDLDPRMQEQWGNFVQTYSMAGIVDCALRLSD